MYFRTQIHLAGCDLKRSSPLSTVLKTYLRLEQTLIISAVQMLNNILVVCSLLGKKVYLPFAVCHSRDELARAQHALLSCTEQEVHPLVTSSPVICSSKGTHAADFSEACNRTAPRLSYFFSGNNSWREKE